ncbi:MULTISPECIES: peptide-methionine (S)-S-oxide reductase MsrA [unclassified Synechococcus]|uniref:peptide-methionine (S)-S-oxide reductase MsrA n=1 Tax=unclassified Synechococcus TaxID=2626047 RepID=UPI001CF84F07|nr:MULTISPECIES: peptide-methionine (S)-S-oxide reductase MsrA [unclassified Synechococcus]MCB4377126.1 peptide-methionine (S)-S-oxide reductase MsrA [Synechococcus sp. MU1650]MCB4411056.1 peptide-methionine (S)-S-oxide reductase MsrA [Synechococcus sp. MU1611]
MLPSWLSPRGGAEASEPAMHAVLGTPLNAPLMADQEEAIFACGCFWGAEKGFWRLPGVVTTAVGYAGGQTEQPTYNQVCSGRTGHTEVVRVVWSRPALDFSDLLKLFWECHDPTQGNRQGNDTGTQYRSAIYTFNPLHLQQAQASRDAYQVALSAKGYGAITTEILADQTFYFAEEYHQQYLAKPGSRPYCSAMPTQTLLGDFEGSNYKLPKQVWDKYDWSISHCVLRSDNAPIQLAS